LKSDLTYEEGPVDILEVQEWITRSRVVKLYKVLWNNHTELDATWEREDYLRDTYPIFFAKQYAFQISG
jgi:hypothetical protein